MVQKEKVEFIARNQNCRNMAIKCYDEQLPNGWEEVQKNIKEVDKKECYIIAIKHDRDERTQNDDMWEPSKEKPHYHFWIIMQNRKQTRPSTMMKKLGIVFREELDDSMYKKKGCERIRTTFTDCALYATHDTKQAEKDGKAPYDVEEIISNLSHDEIMQIRNGYTKPSETRKITEDDMSALDKQAREMGENLQDFKAWYDTLPYSIRKNCGMKTVKESYYRGMEKRARERESIVKLCIYIKGSGNSGKSYNTQKAIQKIGKKYYSVDGGGSGKFDELECSDQAIIINDMTASNILNLTDNYITKAYRRNSGVPYFCGDTVIVTNNREFEEWAKECKIKVKNEYYNPFDPENYTDEFEAFKSRFFICHLGNINGHMKLICESPSTRGTEKDQLERKEKYIEFRDAFNESIVNYHPEKKEVVYEDLNEYKGKELVFMELPTDEEIPFD